MSQNNSLEMSLKKGDDWEPLTGKKGKEVNKEKGGDKKKRQGWDKKRDFGENNPKRKD